ncbi:MAG: hypothetical protein ACOC3E_00970 [Cyanobacteriota bacterium]
MSKVLIIINAEVREAGKILKMSLATERMVAALKDAIAAHSPQPLAVEIIAAPTLKSDKRFSQIDENAYIYCPLTIQLPDNFQFPGKKIYQDCHDVQARRQWVKERFGYATTNQDSGSGHHWLPIVLTAKGPFYGEVIGEGEMPNSYQQPIDLTDEQRQPLYRLAYQLLDSLAAPPSVYLLQFTLGKKGIIFDRLWPFPAAPATASIGKQQPNLFTCHWHCLTGQPIRDIGIPASAS